MQLKEYIFFQVIATLCDIFSEKLSKASHRNKSGVKINALIGYARFLSRSWMLQH